MQSVQTVGGLHGFNDADLINRCTGRCTIWDTRTMIHSRPSRPSRTTSSSRTTICL